HYLLLVTHYPLHRRISGMATIPESHRDIIERSQVVILGTSGPEGEPQVTALWFHVEGDTLRLSVNESRQKLKNLQRDPRASAFFIDHENPYRTIELRGSVSIEPDPGYAFADKVGTKYGSDLRDMDGPGQTRSTVTFTIDKINTFG